MDNARPRALVLGLGNPLMGDDGLGLEAIRTLEASYALPEEVDVLDGGTMGLLLLDRVAGYEYLLVADSVAMEEPPGRVVRIEGDQVGAVFSSSLSPHQTGVNDLLAALTLLGRMPGRITVIGMEPATLEVGIGLSEPVRKGLARMVEALAEELAAWGLPPTRKRGKGEGEAGSESYNPRTPAR